MCERCRAYRSAATTVAASAAYMVERWKRAKLSSAIVDTLVMIHSALEASADSNRVLDVLALDHSVKVFNNVLDEWRTSNDPTEFDKEEHQLVFETVGFQALVQDVVNRGSEIDLTTKTVVVTAVQ